MSEGRPATVFAKISRPRSNKIYPRTRLFRQLDNGCARPIVWVCGPPGAGKTTLVASYLDTRQRTGLWYQLDCGDADVATFFHYLGLAAPDNASPRMLPRLTPERRADLEVFTRRYFEQLYAALAPPFAIVFDNYHTIPPESALHQVFRWALEQMPEGGCSIIISRSDPPNSFGRLESSRAVAFIDAEDLRLRLTEAKGIARLWRQWDKARGLIADMHRSTQGWTAGLVLMLEHGKLSDVAMEEVAAGSRENRFRYFGGEILDHTDAATRDVLLKTALLPSITVDVARGLTDNDQADRIIARMHQRNYFTERLAEAEPVYRYHPLFREFLLASVAKTFSEEQLGELRRRAAGLLEATERFEEAAELCRENHDWDGLARLCRRLAPELLGQGRTDTLKEWLLALPAPDRDNDPWTSYWLGQVELPFDPHQASALFEQAYAGYRRRGDKEQWLAAWSGIVDAIVFCWDDFSRLDPWIEQIERFEREGGQYPSPLSEARTVVSMFSALIFRQPQHPGINRWAQRGLALARECGDPALFIRTVEFQSHFYAWIGDLARAGALLEESNAFLAGDAVPIIVILGNRMQEAVYRWHLADFERAVAAVEDGLAIGSRHGVRLMDTRLAAQGVYASIGANDPGAAEHYLQVMTDALGPGQQLDISHNHYLRGWLALVRGDAAAAVREVGRANRLAEEMGTPFPVAITGLTLARALHALGEHVEAGRHLKRSRELGEAIGSFMLRCIAALVTADFALTAGDEDRAVAELKEGLGIARSSEFWMMPGWDFGLISRLCAFALEHDIEADFVRTLILRRELTPDARYPPGPRWPGRICITTLGGFRIENDGSTLQLDRKGQRKPVELLRALIALGGRDVDERRLADVLWPDADGDAALQSLATTLHRIRKILACDEAIVRRQGRISLNDTWCWVDAIAFDNLLESSEAIGDSARKEQRLLQALTLYGGAFLSEQMDAAWSIPARERLESRFVRAVTILAEHYESQGRLEDATAWYQRGIESAPVSESLYRALIRCNLSQGETAAAASAYRRCERALDTMLGVRPSPKTRKLISALLEEG